MRLQIFTTMINANVDLPRAINSILKKLVYEYICMNYNVSMYNDEIVSL